MATHCPMPGATGEACPMHGGGHDSTPAPQQRCSMQGTCDGPMAALFVIISNQGVLTEPLVMARDLRTSVVSRTAARRPRQPFHRSRLSTSARVNATVASCARGPACPSSRTAFALVEVSCEWLESRGSRGHRARVAASGSAQQSVDYASVSGRVVDPSGGVVPGAQVTARHTQTNVTGDRRHRCRRPLPVSLPARRPVRNCRHLAGFQDATRHLDSRPAPRSSCRSR